MSLKIVSLRDISRREINSKFKIIIAALFVFAATLPFSKAEASIDCGLRFYDGTSIVKLSCENLGTVTSPLRIYDGTNTYGVQLVDTTDSDASKFRIKTSGGTKAIRKIPPCESTFQPSGGANDGTDEGSSSAGKDTYISTNSATTNFGSDPKLMFNYYSSYNGWPLLKFDVSALPASDISSVKLYLYFTNEDCPSQGCNMAETWWTNSITAESWGEMAVTYNTRKAQNATNYGTLTIPAAAQGVPQWVSVDITTLYNAWKAGTVTNHGMGFTRQGSTGDGARWWARAASSDYATPSLRPKLVITRTAGTCE